MRTTFLRTLQSGGLLTFRGIPRCLLSWLGALGANGVLQRRGFLLSPQIHQQAAVFAVTAIRGSTSTDLSQQPDCAKAKEISMCPRIAPRRKRLEQKAYSGARPTLPSNHSDTYHAVPRVSHSFKDASWRGSLVQAAVLTTRPI